MNPKISIVTISYNCESEIEETIQSVINQTYTNKEYLVIDGGSTDGTMAIVDQYRDKIDVIVSEPDKGRSDAFNKGIAKATGDYIVMMNAGDLLADNALSKFAQSFVPGYDVIKGNTILWNAESGYKSIERPVINYHSIPFNFHVCHQSTYISKTAYEKYGDYKTDYTIAMDFELMLRYTHLGAKFYRIDEDLALFRLGGISQSAGKRRYKEMKLAMLDNGKSKINTFVFMVYLHLRTNVRVLLNKKRIDLKSKLLKSK